MNQNADVCLEDTERQELVRRLEQVHAKLADAMRGVGPRLWSSHREAGVWSAAEIVEHILLVEASLLAGVESHLGDKPDSSWEESTRGKKELLERILPTEGKAVAPVSVSNFSGLDQRQALQGLEASRQRFEQFLQRTATLPLKALVWPHSIFGPLSAHHRLLYIVLHSERHLGQLRREVQALRARDATDHSIP